MEIDPTYYSGYRRVPGFGTYWFFDPNTGERRSSRRYFNPSFPVGDPRREISEYQYRTLRRVVISEEPEQLGIASLAAERRKRQQERYRQWEKELAENQGMPRATARELLFQRQLYEYQLSGLASFDPRSQQLRAPRGLLAQNLEAMGMRMPNAWWPVGDSGDTTIFPSTGISPANAQARWRSQRYGEEIA